MYPEVVNFADSFAENPAGGTEPSIWKRSARSRQCRHNGPAEEPRVRSADGSSAETTADATEPVCSDNVCPQSPVPVHSHRQSCRPRPPTPTIRLPKIPQMSPGPHAQITPARIRQCKCFSYRLLCRPGPSTLKIRLQNYCIEPYVQIRPLQLRR